MERHKILSRVPGCRIGFIQADGSIFKRIVEAKANTDLGSPLLTQKAGFTFTAIVVF